MIPDYERWIQGKVNGMTDYIFLEIFSQQIYKEAKKKKQCKWIVRVR